MAQVIGRTTNPFLRIQVVLAAKHTVVEMLEIAAPETAEIVSGENLSRQQQGVWEYKLWENSWLAVAGIGSRP